MFTGKSCMRCVLLRTILFLKYLSPKYRTLHCRLDTDREVTTLFRTCITRILWTIQYLSTSSKTKGVGCIFLKYVFYSNFLVSNVWCVSLRSWSIWSEWQCRLVKQSTSHYHHHHQHGKKPHPCKDWSHLLPGCSLLTSKKFHQKLPKLSVVVSSGGGRRISMNRRAIVS